MRSVVSRLVTVLSVLAGLLMAAILIANTADVALRNAFGGSLRGVVEYTEVALAALVFLSIAPAAKRDAHVAVDILTSMLPGRLSAALQFVGLAVTVCFLAWWTHASYVVARGSVSREEVRFGLVQVPVYPSRIVITLGMALLVFVLLIKLWDLGRIVAGKVQENEELQVTQRHVEEL